MTGEPYTAGGIATTVAGPVPRPTNSSHHTWPGLDEMHGQGTTSLEVKSGYGFIHDEARVSPSPPRSPRRPRSSVPTWCPPAHPPGYVDLVTGPMLAAAARTPGDRRVLRAGRLRRGPGAGDPRGRVHGGLRGRRTRTSCVPAGVQLACELGLVAVDHCTYLSDLDVDALTAFGDDCHAAPRRRVLHPAAVPGRPPALNAGVRIALPATATRARASPRRWRSASRWRSARCGCAPPRRSTPRPPWAPPPSTATTSGCSPPARPPTSSSSTRRRTSTSPIAPASARGGGLAARPPGCRHPA